MTDKMKSILRSATTLWIIGIFAVGVFYIDNHYFNILETKALFCDMAALIFLAVSALAALISLMERSGKEVLANARKNLRPLDVSVACFMLAAVFSNLITEHPQQAFWGSYGWSVGTLWVVLMGLTYFFVSRNAQPDRKILVFLGLVAGLQFLLVIANGFMLDPFGLHEGLSSKDYGRYVGTVGNTNWYVGYVTMLMPFFLMGTGKEKPVWEKWMCRVLLFLASMTFITINSQGVYLGVGAVVAAYLYLSMEDYHKIRNALVNTMIMVAAVGVVSLGKSRFSIVELDELNSFFIKPWVWVGALVVLGMFYLGLTMVKEPKYEKMKVWIRGVYMAAVVLAAAGLIITQVQSFDDSWGTNRGKTWRVAVQAFSSMPFINKLFGGGTNCFGYYYLAQTGSDWVRNAHNEYLEYLVTTGLFGVLSYVGIYAGCFADRSKSVPRQISVKSKNTSLQDTFIPDLHTACGLAVLGYAAQALVNNPQALNGAMLVTILALYRRTGQKMVE